jgi:hypothetical protein
MAFLDTGYLLTFAPPVGRSSQTNAVTRGDSAHYHAIRANVDTINRHSHHNKSVDYTALPVFSSHRPITYIAYIYTLYGALETLIVK